MRRSDLRTPLRLLLAFTLTAAAFSAAALTLIVIKNYLGFVPTPPFTCTSSNLYYVQKYATNQPYAASTVGVGLATVVGIVQSILLFVLLADFNRQTGDYAEWDGLEHRSGSALAVLWSMGTLGSAVAGGHYLAFVMERDKCGNGLVLEWLLIAGFALIACILQAVCLSNLLKLRKILPAERDPLEKLIPEKVSEKAKSQKKEIIKEKTVEEPKKTEIAKEQLVERIKEEEKPLKTPLLQQTGPIYQPAPAPIPPRPVEVQMVPIPKQELRIQKPIEPVYQRPRQIEKREEPEKREEMRPSRPKSPKHKKQLRQESSQIQYVQVPQLIQPQPQLQIQPPIPQPQVQPPPQAAPPSPQDNSQPSQNNTNIHFHFTPNGITPQPQPNQQPQPQPIQQPVQQQPIQPVQQQPIQPVQPQIIYVPQPPAPRSKPKRNHRQQRKDIIAESREEQLSSDSDEKYYKRARKYKKKRLSKEKYREQEERYRQEEERYDTRRHNNHRNYEPPHPYHYPYSHQRIVVVAPPPQPQVVQPQPPAVQPQVVQPPPIQPQPQPLPRQEQLLPPSPPLQHHQSSSKLTTPSPSRQKSVANIKSKLSFSPQANIQISLQPKYEPLPNISPISKHATLPRQQPAISHRQYSPDSDHEPFPLPLSRSKIDSLREENLVQTLRSGHFWEDKAQHPSERELKQLKGKMDKDKNSLSQYIEDLNESYARLQVQGAHSDYNYSSILSQVEQTDRKKTLTNSQARQAGTLLLDRIRQKYS